MKIALDIQTFRH